MCMRAQSVRLCSLHNKKKQEYFYETVLNVLLALLMLVSSTALADANGNWTLADIKEKGPSRLTEEPITLKVFCGADVKPNIIDNIEENLMTQWMEERTGVHIEWIVSSGGDSVTALNMSLASGDYPDI